MAKKNDIKSVNMTFFEDFKKSDDTKEEEVLPVEQGDGITKKKRHFDMVLPQAVLDDLSDMAAMNNLSKSGYIQQLIARDVIRNREDLSYFREYEKKNR